MDTVSRWVIPHNFRSHTNVVQLQIIRGTKLQTMCPPTIPAAEGGYLLPCRSGSEPDLQGRR